ncbi:MAG TPA: hypothetical protein VIS05_03205 [Ilumatobacter sp.]
MATGATGGRATLGAGPGVEFCGEVVIVDRDPFVMGRAGDLSIDDANRFLHRRFLCLTRHSGVWVLANVGHRLTATVSDPDRRLDAFLAPGAVVPLVTGDVVVRFTAGPTNYEVAIRPGGRWVGASPEWLPDAIAGDATVGDVAMTPDQLRLVLALAEPALRSGNRSAVAIPTSNEAARRLGWTITKFNRKLDNVCHKLELHGVRGVHGGPGRLASNRRARLVEHALAVRMVTHADLDLLDVRAPGT